jgi:hypothetical protein
VRFSLIRLHQKNSVMNMGSFNTSPAARVKDAQQFDDPPAQASFLLKFTEGCSRQGLPDLHKAAGQGPETIIRALDEQHPALPQHHRIGGRQRANPIAKQIQGKLTGNFLWGPLLDGGDQVGANGPNPLVAFSVIGVLGKVEAPGGNEAQFLDSLVKRLSQSQIIAFHRRYFPQ